MIPPAAQRPAPPPADPASLQPSIPGVNTMAIAGLIFAIPLPPIGIVMGHVAKSQIRRTGESGSGIATAALVIGYIMLLCVCIGVPLSLMAIGV
jgi:hypothetical protein